MGKTVSKLSRGELLGRISALESQLARLRAQLDDNDLLRQAVTELAVHQEELAAQNEQLHKAQTLLEESNHRYAELYDFAPLGYVTLDLAGLIQEANLTACAMLGTERAKVLEMPLIHYVAAEDRQLFAEHLLRCRGGASQVETELRLQSSSGRLVPVSCHQGVIRRRRTVSSARRFWT